MAVPQGLRHREARVTKGMTDTKALNAVSPPATDTANRSSFSSVRENDDGLAQTFTHSKVSSYTQVAEEVFDESPGFEPSQQPFFQPPLTRPHSKLNGFLYPADSFKGWREIPLKGKKASRSCEDLHKLHMTWSLPVPAVSAVATVAVDPPVGRSRLEVLPSEILGKTSTLNQTLRSLRQDFTVTFYFI